MKINHYAEFKKKKKKFDTSIIGMKNVYGFVLSENLRSIGKYLFKKYHKNILQRQLIRLDLCKKKYKKFKGKNNTETDFLL